jgi:hypothetical protein
MCSAERRSRALLVTSAVSRGQAFSKEIRDERGRVDQMLEFVEAEHQLPVTKDRRQSLNGQLLAGFPDAERLGDGGKDERRIGKRGEVDEGDAVRIDALDLARHFQGKPCFADTARSDQRHQTSAVAQPLDHRVDFTLLSDEARQWNRQSRLESISIGKRYRGRWVSVLSGHLFGHDPTRFAVAGRVSLP